MSAYYNEIDPFAAAWLRELIKAGQIGSGEVDERSITEVQPADLRGFTQCHFFAGIGVWSYALRAAGWPNDTPVWTGSCPCQSFSASGKRGGFSDSRHLWPAWFRLIRECRPDTMFGEQVASKDGLTWLDVVSADLEGAGYAVGAADLCAAGFGAPHIRQRLYFVANAERNGRQPDEPGRGSLRREVDGRDCEAGRMADAASSRRQGTREHGSGALPLPARPKQCGDLGDPAQRGLGMRGSASGQRGRAAQSGESHCLGHTLGAGLEERSSQRRNSSEEFQAAERTSRGFTNGFWADAEWLWCRDEKYRAVEPGTSPLVAGAPNRMGRLRGYGNALCAEVAKGFIEAYIEVRALKK